MRNILLFVVVALVAGFVGYWFGTKSKNECNPKYITEEELNLKQMIPIEKGRALNTNFERYADCELSPSIAHLLGNPIDIPDAKKDFELMFKQDSVKGLRAYPGLRVSKNGKKEFTLVIVGIDSLGKIIYKPSVIKQDETEVQDNNNPCKPCGNL